MEEVGTWDRYIVEGYEGGTRGVDTGVVHTARGDTWRFEGNDEEGDTGGSSTTSTDGGSAIVGPDAVSDPFLRSVYNVVITFADGSGFDACNVGTGW